jgi:hypothetical protein
MHSKEVDMLLVAFDKLLFHLLENNGKKFGPQLAQDTNKGFPCLLAMRKVLASQSTCHD